MAYLGEGVIASEEFDSRAINPIEEWDDTDSQPEPTSS